MRSASPRKFATESQLYTAALRALMRRAHSVHEMKEYLKTRAENPDDAAAVLQRLREQNYVDDARYAREYARSHAQSRRQGKFRIARELRARGVPDKHIEAALDAVFAETDENALVRARIERKLRQVRGPLDEKKRASIYRSLLRAGFSADAIRTELRVASKAGTARDNEQETLQGEADNES
ncbi:MAG TPA: regulatory protein RecX [Candidatus Acidoferrales bacterium]|nr:regulatory protein RecX [Candidatus Acidoferrales bacterium]